MDTYSSGEELVIKTRKPYTITKQRERWTEEEHGRFLEALKLYGRAWQRIEEHIGTKTAVQIRSHAQKFFTKLEKEALVKGIPIGQALDIEIPPPRPKRKPSNPYPRKTSIGTPTSQVESKDEKSGNPLPRTEHILDLEKEPVPEKPGDEKFGNEKENQDDNKYARSFILVQGSSGISPSSANKSSSPTSTASGKSRVFKEFVPAMNEVVNGDETNESYVTVEPGANQKLDKFYTVQSFEYNGTCNSTNLAKSHPLKEKLAEGKRNELEQSENFDIWSKNDGQSPQSQPRHVAVQILDGSLTMNSPNVSAHMPYQESMFHQISGPHPNIFSTFSSSATSDHQTSASRFSINQSFAGFHPIFTPVQNLDDYQSFLHASSTFSNLIVSALSQNPAAHAAASFAASFWPCSTTDAPAESPGGGGFIARQMNAAPSIASIAAATVAAATAWWAAHGLLPLCAPFPMGLNYVPGSASTVPISTTQARADVAERREETSDVALDAQQLEPEISEALQEQHSTSKSPTMSLSDSEESNGLKPSTGLTATKSEQAAAATELHDSNKLKGRKQADRSSCGSNTPSSSEVETDALEKLEKGKEELKEPAGSHPTADASGRRSRSSSSTNDSWKEVSEEGRLAFRALFSREVLPQSFSPPHDSKTKGENTTEKDKQNVNEKGDDTYQLDLNGKTCANCSSNQEVENNFLRSLNVNEEGLLTMGKLKVRRTGFKPYKRCSLEAKDSRVTSTSSQEEDKATKRIRLEGKASTH